MLRTRTARWSAGAAGLCVLLLAVAWFLLVSPRRAQAADLADQNASAQQANAKLQLQIEGLKAQSAQLPTFRAQLATLLRQLPATADMPTLVRDLNSFASESGVQLDTLTPGSATFFGVKPGAVAGGAAGGAGGGAAKPTGVVEIPISLVARGDYFQAVAFLQKVQTQLSRVFLVREVQVAQSSSGGGPGQIQLTITGGVFSWPAGAQALSSTGSGTNGSTATEGTGGGTTPGNGAGAAGATGPSATASAPDTATTTPGATAAPDATTSAPIGPAPTAATTGGTP
ncbi:MAG TPA: type 4a pilus biogenesis protein PilO [Kineosporiaceae bacterium]|nr:type 4a pilus biogenesis protein PilO [Kineosporiaceae bacterium]